MLSILYENTRLHDLQSNNLQLKVRKNVQNAYSELNIFKLAIR